MSIALGLITSKGVLIVASDGKGKNTDDNTVENHNKTFSLLNGQIIGASTGIVKFSDGNSIQKCLENYIETSTEEYISKNMFDGMMVYLKNKLIVDQYFEHQNKCTFILFLYYSNNIPHIDYYHIVPEDNFLKIENLFNISSNGNYRVIGNNDVANFINMQSEILKNINTIDEMKEFLKQAVENIQPDDCNTNIFTQIIC